MGNVWINDHNHDEQNNDQRTKHGSFGKLDDGVNNDDHVGAQAKKSTNYEEELNLDDYEALLNKSNESPDTKFTKEGKAKDASMSESILYAYF